MDESELIRELQEARATVADQAMQIRQFQHSAEKSTGLSAALELLELQEVVNTVVGQAPNRLLLDAIVQAAAQLFEAGASSILLLDEGTNELVFEAATGNDVLNLRIPAHQGIAGWVVMTGEPIVVSDVKRDPRWAKDFAKSTGYVPNSILAVPLLAGDDVVGVLEVLDKRSAASFGLDDMQLLGMFARPAALAVEQGKLLKGLARLLLAELQRLADEAGQHEVARAMREALDGESASSEEMLQLAGLVQAVSRRGEAARRLAIELLEGIARFLA